MAVGKNKKYKTSGKKGEKKRAGDPFARKDWYDIRVPNLFAKRCIGKTLVNRTCGQNIASENLKGRVFEATLAELQNDQDPERNYRKLLFIAEAVDGSHILTNFYGMDLTTDKYRSMVLKWQTLIEASVDAKTIDGYTLRVFCMGFTRKSKDSTRKTCYAYNSKKRAIRERMVEIITTEVGNCNLKEVINKLALDMISKDIERKCERIYPLHIVYIRKVKVLKKPRFDLHKLMELHSSDGALTVVEGRTTSGPEGAEAIPPEGLVIERPKNYEPPVQSTV